MPWLDGARWFSAEEAARHLGTSTESFRRAVRRGILPAPSYKLGPQSPRWHSGALDRAMGVEEESDMGDTINAVADKIKAAAENRLQGARRRNYQNV